MIVLHACRAAGHMARNLLGCVDHVVSMGAKVEPELCALCCAAFFEALTKPYSIGEAVRCARRVAERGNRGCHRRQDSGPSRGGGRQSEAAGPVCFRQSLFALT